MDIRKLFKKAKEQDSSIKHLNEIKFKEDGSRFVTQFNLCSDLWAKANDETLSEEERNEYYGEWFSAKYNLETGQY